MKDDEELVQSVRKNHLPQAIKAIESDGQYWPGAVTRAEAKVLGEMLENAGHDILVHELPPEWEHVIALTEEPYDELKVIAEERARESW